MFDLINSIFELGGGFMLWLNVYKLHNDKQAKGVHIASVIFWSIWGYWNLIYYPSLNQWMSFLGGISVALANTVWLFQIIYYTKREAMNNADETT